MKLNIHITNSDVFVSQQLLVFLLIQSLKTGHKLDVSQVQLNALFGVLLPASKLYPRLTNPLIVTMGIQQVLYLSPIKLIYRNGFITRIALYLYVIIIHTRRAPLPAQSMLEADQYQDVIDLMKRSASAYTHLTVEQVNTLHQGLKYAFQSEKRSWQPLCSTLKQEEQANSKFINLVLGYKNKVEQQLTSKCRETLHMIQTKLIPKIVGPEAEAINHRRKGDLYRDIAEYTNGDQRQEAIVQAEIAYEAGLSAVKHLKAADPIRMGLILSYSDFLFNVKKEVRKGHNIVRESFFEAIEGLEEFGDTQWKQTTTIMSAMRNNITDWASMLIQESQGADDV